MAEHSTIEWTDATWNPITGCSVVSPGCANCYAMRLAGTRLQHHPTRAGLTRDSKAGPVWTGEVRLNPEWLDQPLRWKRPRMIFVCAHGDLFHESVSNEWIDRVFAVMARAPWHTFQVLTKRAERMRRYMTEAGAPLRVEDLTSQWRDRHGGLIGVPEWPIPNVWLGVSAEDQDRLAERWPYLATTPAAVRWISAEPLLGPLNLTTIWPDATMRMNALTGEAEHLLGDKRTTARLDWLVAGGESGPGARPMHPDWARSLRDQCKAAGGPFHFKQWGEWAPFIDPEGFERSEGGGREGAAWEGGRWVQFPLGDRHGHVFRLGKSRAGRLLDGREHNGMPGAS